MDQITPAGETAQLNPTVLPGIEHVQTVARPQTCDSSATTVPPSSIRNTDDSTDPVLDVPIATLQCALPSANEAPPSSVTLKHQGARTQPRSVKDQAIANNQVDEVSPEPAVESQIEGSVRELQKGKRRAPPQGSKTKRPRLGASKGNLKKRTRAATRKPRQVKAKKTSAAKQAPKKGRRKAQSTQNALNEVKEASAPLEAAEKGNKNIKDQNAKASFSANDTGIVITERASNLHCSQSGVGEIEKNERDASHATEKVDGCSAGDETVITTGLDSSRGKRNDASQTNGNVSAEAGSMEKEKQSSNDALSCEVDKEQRREKGQKPTRASGDKDRKDSENQDAIVVDGIDKTDTAGCDAQEEAALREKYEDLSRRYLSLVRGLIQSGSDKKDDDSDDSVMEASDGRAQTHIVDKKLYDTIYMCKVAGMLGSMKISDGPSNYMRAHRLRGVEDPYKRVVKDGLEFVEDLMKLGMPDDNSCASVKAVFRDVHIRLVKDIWERNEDNNGARALLVDMMTMLGEQIRMWYMKMMDGEINVLWSELIAVTLAEGLYKNVVKMDEEISGNLMSCLQGILKHISEYYEECEQKPEMACVEKFCYSCEISISIARSVPEAALSLNEEVAYVIGRHNGVFAHCVSRLVAERDGNDGNDGGGSTTSGR